MGRITRLIPRMAKDAPLESRVRRLEEAVEAYFRESEKRLEDLERYNLLILEALERLTRVAIRESSVRDSEESSSSAQESRKKAPRR